MGDFIDDRYGVIIKTLFLLVLFLISIIGIIQFNDDPMNELAKINSLGLLPFILMVSAAVLGYFEKSIISFKKGRWKKRERLIAFEEYEQILQEHKKEFSKIYDDWDDCSGCCCSMSVPLILFLVFGMVPEEFGVFFLDPTFFMIYIFLGYSFLGFASYKIGYHSKKFKKKNFFKAPSEDKYEYVKSISQLSDIITKARIETKEMDEYVALYDTDWFFYIDGLPETVSMNLKMEKSDWPCGFLVGTIVNGPHVEERIELLPLEDFCPAIMQYSNSEKGTIIVCKYEIESSKCDWDFEGYPDIANLAKFLVLKLRELHSTRNLF